MSVLWVGCPLTISRKSELNNVIISKLMRFNFSKIRHVGFEAALWYWHFVDVV
jgi:hypothetical protein